ncbi:MAG: UDP-N-acetylmuramoyl-L-alanyl-D-glutamate--2,6-diaminopimelate ligase, partial [Desulfobacterales bacterium]|nr:UDP-N-acetylmuramoyl-L-alanyl-D-glutamate--2,6-diaminopimelate ligase [Desulfobacterales bacterium]
MKLSELLLSMTHKIISGIDKNSPDSPSNPEIGSVHYKAQDVKRGGLFVAIPGFVSDGHDFIDTAIENGASAIITQRTLKKDAIIIEVENTRKALASISSRFYEHPSEKLIIIGVTGTNGKTTITFLLESILSTAGYKVGVIGTINYRYAGKTFENPRTTPESLDLQRMMSEMLEEGITHVIIEVASHAIELHRIDNTWINVGVFTNLTQDHLDFHGNIESYWSCKKQMFTKNMKTGPKKAIAMAVINQDDPKGEELIQSIDLASISVGTSKSNHVFPENSKLDLTGIKGTISTPDGNIYFSSDLIGGYNLENILCAAGVGIALKIPLEHIKEGIQTAPRIPGRLERVQNNIERFVYVDYAHTPDALENVLTSLKNLATNRIICVFGCGGDRDKGKRPKMGKIAGELSDLAIVTSD